MSTSLCTVTTSEVFSRAPFLSDTVQRQRRFFQNEKISACPAGSPHALKHSYDLGNPPSPIGPVQQFFTFDTALTGGHTFFGD